MFKLAEKEFVYMEKSAQLINSAIKEIERYFNNSNTDLKTIFTKGNAYNEVIINTPKYYALKFPLLERFLNYFS